MSINQIEHKCLHDKSHKLSHFSFSIGYIYLLIYNNNNNNNNNDDDDDDDDDDD